jgi:site-specific recombinase XerC
MNEQEAIEQLLGEYLATNGTETPARVRYHNEALDTAIAALNEVQEYHATGRTPNMVRGLSADTTGRGSSAKKLQVSLSSTRRSAHRSSAGKLWSVPVGFR